MKLFGLEITRHRKSAPVSLDTLIRRLEAAYETSSGVAVTPETAMQAPTVHAIVIGISRAIASLPLHVLRKSEGPRGRTVKERQPSHPVQRLLDRPNDWQSPVEYWSDAASAFVRYGNFYAFKARGETGPIRRLIPIPSGDVQVEQGNDLSLTYRITQAGGRSREIGFAEMHHVRGPARNGFVGDSPVMDVREAISLEMAAERFGASFFGNGATPSILFEYADGFSGFKTPEEEQAFIEDFQQKYKSRRRLSALLPPRGLKMTPVDIQNDKAQFLETRKAQRTVIAGALGVPPHIVGDLDRGIRSNIEQQSIDWVQKVVLPIARTFEAAMERDLLTQEDRRGGIVIRFNLDGLLRGDFKSQQEGLKIQRESGVISPNEWREEMGRNPREGGDTYWEQGPSGQTSDAPGDPGATPDDARTEDDDEQTA